jgi:hypothetical protein
VKIVGDIGKAILYDTELNKEVGNYEATPGFSVIAHAISSDGKYLAVGSMGLAVIYKIFCPRYLE